MPSKVIQPEIYFTTPNPSCPNSKLPILVYRNVLPQDLTVESSRDLIEKNDWIYDRSWKSDITAHFHTNTHECYAATKGSTTCLYGVGPSDDEKEGVSFSMKAGDIAVHGAGTVHRNFESSDDYEYMALYPKGSPHYNSFRCNYDAETIRSMAEDAEQVPLPTADPIYGPNGPLLALWKEARAKHASSDAA